MTNTPLPKVYTEIKTILIGDSFVGKTSIVNRIYHDKFQEGERPTLSASYLPLYFDVGNHEVTVNLWDTAGDEKYRSLIPYYTRTANVLIVVFDLSVPSSFDGAAWWLEELKKSLPDTIMTWIVGNKLDIVNVDEINQDRYANWADSHNAKFVMTSAKDGTNIAQMFNDIAASWVRSCQKPTSTSGEEVDVYMTENQKSCC